MTRMDRHLVRRLVGSFFLLVGLFVVFFVVLHYVDMADEFYDHGATLREIVLVYYPSYVPEIVKLVSPIALFLGTVYLTGRMAQELQLMALSTSGVSLYRILVPYLCVGVAVTGGMFWFNGWIVPESNRTRIDFERQYRRAGGGSEERTHVYRQTGSEGILRVGYYDPDDQVAHRVSLLAFRPSGAIARRIDAASMEWNDSTATWRLVNLTVHRFEDGSEITSREVTARDTTIGLYPRDLTRREHDVAQLTIPAASEHIRSLRRSGVSNLGRPLVAYYDKFAYPLANLILVLVGVPLASVRRRGGQAVQIGLGFGLAFCYLALMRLIEPFGYSGLIDPLLATVIPHATFLLLGIALLITTRK